MKVDIVISTQILYNIDSKVEGNVWVNAPILQRRHKDVER